MKKLNRVGEKYVTNEGYSIEIIEYFGSKNITILLDNLITLYKIEFKEIISKNIKNKNHPSVYNTGYLGYGIKNSVENENSYNVWSGIIQRCYGKSTRNLYPTYKDVKVCEEWKCFQNFAKWFEENYNPEIMEGWHLDKDILSKGNKIYSPETCCFVPQEINGIFIKRGKDKEGLPIGINKSKSNKYKSSFNNLHLGTFNTIEEAFEVYKTTKEEYIKEIADKWKGKISDQVYQTLYNYQVELPQ